MLVRHLAIGQLGELLLQRRPLRRGLRSIAWMSSGNLLDRRLGRTLAVAAARSRRSARGSSAVFASHAASFSACGLTLAGRGQRQVVARQQRGEERLQAVVVLLQDRIELVVVAAGAAHAQAEEDVGGHVGDVVEDVGPLAGGRRAGCTRRCPAAGSRWRPGPSGSSGASSSPASCSATKRS